MPLGALNQYSLDGFLFRHFHSSVCELSEYLPQLQAVCGFSVQIYVVCELSVYLPLFIDKWRFFGLGPL